MPFGVATFPFLPAPEVAGAVSLVRPPSATALGILDASFVTLAPFGTCTTLASLGLDAGVAPQEATRLVVASSVRSFENAALFGFGGYASARSALRVFVEEFLPSGAFLRGVPGPDVVVFDAFVAVFGLHIRSRERHIFAPRMTLPVVPGRFYRVWIDVVQSAGCGGQPVAPGLVSGAANFTYTLAPVFFDFVR